ncbi:hypothetical protein GBF38_015519 [Nibea albiflora]|uniref:Uncharacterized protein n=1 Tax=Nibea albiflora TaxID=240163 RepID=A0ACB7EM50_NIBAL|nr:hypothetical protein GBF38_015519 [Nibea albiflora]
MPGEDKPPQHTRQRKKNKKSRSKGKGPGGSPGPLSIDGQDELFLPPVLQPPPKKQEEGKPKVPVTKLEEESSFAICLQVLFPYLLAGMGMVMAGMVLDNVQPVLVPSSLSSADKHTSVLTRLIPFTPSVAHQHFSHPLLYCIRYPAASDKG